MVHCSKQQNLGSRDQHFLRLVPWAALVSPFVILLLLGTAGSHLLFCQQERIGLKKWRSEGHAHPLIRTVWQSLLQGPIKINIPVSGSIAVSMSVHVDSCTMYFYFLLSRLVPVTVSVLMEMPPNSCTNINPCQAQECLWTSLRFSWSSNFFSYMLFSYWLKRQTRPVHKQVHQKQ